jgi:glycosyltransferase involved in cell wall biosynthesis
LGDAVTQVFLKDLTVIIACKDRIDNLRYCISSIAQGNGIPNVCIVDFGSLTKIEFNNKPWVKVLRVNARTSVFHKARALNIGIKHVKTKYICITDADQIFSRNFFTIINKLLNKNPNYFLQCLTYGLLRFPKDITPENIMENYSFLIERARKDRPQKTLYGDGCCHAMTLKYALRFGGYEEAFVGWGYEDSDMAWRARINKKKILFIHSLASMLHLPHETTSVYYSKDIKIKNRSLYMSRRSRKIRVANENKAWGNLV